MSSARAGRPLLAHKVVNNNVVISVDENGDERVLMGRGIGFGLKPEDTIDPAKVDKTFVLDSGPDGERARRLIRDVRYHVIDAVAEAVDDAERLLQRDLGRRLTLAVVDHIQYVLERLDQGIRIPTTSMPELRVLHPREFEAASAMAADIAGSLGRDLPPEEAVFLTMHLLNATRDEPEGTSALQLRRLQHVVHTVETELGVALDVDSADYARFVLHVQFLMQRLVTSSMLRSSDTSFYDFANHSYPRSAAIARKVDAYVRQATGTALTEEELLYVIVHVERLASQVA